LIHLLAEDINRVNMTVSYDYPSSRVPAATSMATLEDRFEVIKEVGDGSFGSVAVARVRTAGSNVARRGTMVRNPIADEISPSDHGPVLIFC
jgi:hypothetical protein